MFEEAIRETQRLQEAHERRVEEEHREELVTLKSELLCNARCLSRMGSPALTAFSEQVLEYFEEEAK